MDYKFFLIGIKNIILNPVKAWEIIYSENKPVKLIRNNLLFPSIFLVSISAFFGSLIFTNIELSPVYSIFVSIKCFLMLYITIYATSFVFSEITYPLDLGRDFNASFKIILYSMVPFLICQVLSRLFESLLFVNIMGLYGLYIFWSGTEKVLDPPQYKKMPMLIAATVTLAGIYVLSNLMLTMLIDRIYYAYFA